MPPTGYLSAAGIESCLQYLATTYPTITQLFVLPEKSIEGRTIRALKIAKGAGSGRRAVLFIGGVHARELINPDTIASFGLKMCQAYTGNTGLTFGGKSYNAGTIKLIVEAMDIFLLPLVNPDGRVFVQSAGGDPWWRKNRNPNPGKPCKGVDLNRNYDFLWSSGIGTSADSCSDVFKGSGAFSEPETRNVRYMLDHFTNICCFMDIHSYSQLVLYPWGDDDNQTADASMNFQNPVWNGLRGQPGNPYKEFIPAADLNRYISTGQRIRDAIAAVRGRVYTLEQSIGLYPTTGTSEDYAYTRNFVDASKRKVIGYTVETALEFQPPYSEALNVMAETSAGMIEFCTSCLCAVEATTKGLALTDELTEMRSFRDEILLKSVAGRRYAELLQNNTAEIIEILGRDVKLGAQALEIMQKVNEVTRTQLDKKPKVFDDKLVSAADKILQSVAAKGSANIKENVAEVRRDLTHFRGRTALKGLELASRNRKDPTKKETTKKPTTKKATAKKATAKKASKKKPS
jgi:carboxypeptidase T